MLERMKSIIDMEKLKGIKHKKRKAIIAVVLVSAMIIGVVFYSNVIVTAKKYDKAIGYFEEYEYENALALFTALGDYKDSAKRAEECSNLILKSKYDKALKLYREEKYDEALNILKDMQDYENSKSFYEQCLGKSRQQKEQANIDPTYAAYYEVISALTRAHGEAQIKRDPNNRDCYSMRGVHTVALVDTDFDGNDELLVGWCDGIGDEGAYRLYTFDGATAQMIYEDTLSNSGSHDCFVIKLYQSDNKLLVYNGSESSGYTVAFDKTESKRSLTWKKDGAKYYVNGKSVSEQTYRAKTPMNYTVTSPVDSRSIYENNMFVYPASYLTKAAASGKLSDCDYYTTLFKASYERARQ